MSSMSRPKQPLGWDSPCHRLHLNFLRYSCRKLRFVLPFIFLNLFLATDQLLSACWVWTPVSGSKKLSEWFTVWRLKPRALWIRLYAAHSSVWTKELGFTCLWIIGKSIAALRLLTSCKYGLAIVDIEEILLFNVVGLVLHTGFEDACYEHISLLKSGEDNQWIQLKIMLIKAPVPAPYTIFQHSIRLALRKWVSQAYCFLFQALERYSYSLSFHMTTFALFLSYENPTNCSFHRILISEIHHL